MTTECKVGNSAVNLYPRSLKTMQTTKNQPKSMAMLASAMLVFGTVGIFRRLIPMSSGVIAFSRAILGTLFILVWIKLRKLPFRHNLSKKTIFKLVISGTVMGFNWILLFEACNYTTVSTATLCYYMEPVIVVLASALLFREKLGLRRGLCAAAAFLGMVFVSGIAENGMPAPDELKGILLGLGAAAFYATVVLFNKHTPGVDPYEKTIIQLLSAAAAMIPYLLLTEHPETWSFTPAACAMLLTVGLIHTGLCYVLFFGSMDGLRSGTIAIFSYIDPVTALILSALLLHEQLTPLGIIGALLVLGSAALSELLP